MFSGDLSRASRTLCSCRHFSGVLVVFRHSPARHCPNVAPMLVQRCRRWPNIGATLGQCSALTEWAVWTTQSILCLLPPPPPMAWIIQVSQFRGKNYTWRDLHVMCVYDLPLWVVLPVFPLCYKLHYGNWVYAGKVNLKSRGFIVLSFAMCRPLKSRGCSAVKCIGNEMCV